jgi:hypothetical protein
LGDAASLPQLRACDKFFPLFSVDSVHYYACLAFRAIGNDAGAKHEPRGEDIMNETQNPRRLGRSLVALLAGMFAGILLSLGTDYLLHLVGLFPALGQPVSSPLLLLATAYRTVYSVASSYIAARLAPNQPMMHALVLGMLGFVVSIVGAVVTWNMGPAFGPHWYPVALIVLALPSAWVGGKLRVSQLGARGV